MMSREIIFRAWNKRLKEMFTVYSIDFDAGLVFCVSKNGTRHTFGMIDVELLQYTGLKDRYGAKIYEGNIIQTPYEYIESPYSSCESDEGLFRGLVHYRPSKGFMQTHVRKKSCVDQPENWSKHSDLESIAQFKTTIIGNIYENPELLGDDNEN